MLSETEKEKQKEDRRQLIEKFMVALLQSGKANNHLEPKNNAESIGMLAVACVKELESIYEDIDRGYLPRR